MGLFLQEGGALLLVGSSLADMVGTLLEVFHAQGIPAATSSTLTPGIVLIIVGGGSGILGLAIFLAGHLRASAQQESCHYSTKQNLIKFSQYSAFYSCSVGGLLDTAGTLVEILKETQIYSLVSSFN